MSAKRAIHNPWVQSVAIAALAVIFVTTVAGVLYAPVRHPPAGDCVDGADAAQMLCLYQREEDWYQAGASNIDREQRMKNNDKCRAVRDAALKACKGE